MTHAYRAAAASLSLLVIGAAPLFAQAKPAAKSLYDRLGGEAAIRLVVNDFVAVAAADPKVNFTRGGAWKASDAAVLALKEHLVTFLGQAFGGPQKYAGRGMKETHRGMAITRAEFDALAADLNGVLEKHKVGKGEIAEVMKIAASTAPDIVEK